MASSKQQIANVVTDYMRTHGGVPRSWYVGISKDARSRLFNDHNVREYGDLWIYEQAFTAQDAREVEAYFVNTVGTAGGPGGGDSTADTVYAYRKAPHTRQ